MGIISNFGKNIKRRCKENQPSNGLIVFSILALVIMGYLPTLMRNYFPEDEARVFRYSDRIQTPYKRAEECAKLVTPFYVRTGRPLVWLGECFDDAAVGKISDFRFLRPFMLALVLATILYIGATIAPVVGGLAMGAAAAALLVFAPGFSFMYFQGFTAAMVFLSLIFAAASFKMLYRWLEKMEERMANRQLPNRIPIAPLLLFIAACMMFPAWAFIVVPLAFVYLGFDVDRPVHKRAGRFAITLVFYFIASIIYYFIIKFFVAIDLWGAKGIPKSAISGFQMSINLNLADLLRRAVFLADYFLNLPILNINFGRGAYVFVLALFSIYLGSQFAKSRNKKNISTMAWSIVIFASGIVVLIGAEAPWFFSHFQDGMDPSFVIPLNLFFSISIVGLLWAAVRNASAIFKKLALIFLVLFLLAPLAAIQNELSFLETIATGSEINLMRLYINKWLDNKGYVNNRLLLVVLPKNYRPFLISKSFLHYADAGNNLRYTTNDGGFSPDTDMMINAILHGRPNQPIGKTVHMADCGFNQFCAETQIRSGKVVILDYNGKPIISTKKPFIINLSILSGPEQQIVPKIEIVKNFADAERLIIKKYGNELPNITGPVLVVQGYKGFNIIFYKGKYYGITQNEGAFSMKKIKSGGYKELFSSKSLINAEAKIYKYSLKK